MTLFYVSPSLDNNEEKHEEMILWKQVCVIMISMLLFCRSWRYRSKNKKMLLSKDYCKDKRKSWKPVRYNSFLWTVDRPGSPPTYLFGTIHAPYNLVWRYIPINAKDALLYSSHVYTEVNSKDSNVIEAIQQCRQLPGNLTLRDVLPRKLYKKLRYIMKQFQRRRKQWLTKLNHPWHAERDIYKKNYKLRPIFLLHTILKEWNKFYVKSELRPHHQSLDDYLVDSSIEYGNYKGGIEDVSMHCDPMINLASNRVNLALNVSLFAQEMKMYGKWRVKENDIRHVVNLYKCGNPLNTTPLNTLFGGIVNKSLQKQLAEIDDYLSTELIFKRNVEMAKRMDNMFRNNSYNSARMYFAVGAAHLLGNNSVVTMLRKKGYIVRHIKADEDIPPTKRRKELVKSTKWNPPENPVWRQPIERETRKKKDPYVYYSNCGNDINRSPYVTSSLFTIFYCLSNFLI